ncbi:MAG TPA: hypothetical protein VKE94_22385 [Gemmataceae bacterium]|nr:hypothetical protein [Gemmataceae bacterium]
MRRWFTFVGTLCLVAGFAGGARAGDKPQLEITDPELPLYELRANDRRVIGLTLEGRWQKPAKSGSHHYVNLVFPNGQSYSIRVDEHPVAVRKLVGESKDGKLTYRQVEDSPFRRGEVRCLIPDNQISRIGLARGGKFKVVVSVDRPVSSADAPEVISNALEISWPIQRALVRRPPQSRHGDPQPVDAMPIGDQEPKPEVRYGG